MNKAIFFAFIVLASCGKYSIYKKFHVESTGYLNDLSQPKTFEFVPGKDFTFAAKTKTDLAKEPYKLTIADGTYDEMAVYNGDIDWVMSMKTAEVAGVSATAVTLIGYKPTACESLAAEDKTAFCVEKYRCYVDGTNCKTYSNNCADYNESSDKCTKAGCIYVAAAGGAAAQCRTRLPSESCAGYGKDYQCNNLNHCKWGTTCTMRPCTEFTPVADKCTAAISEYYCKSDGKATPACVRDCGVDTDEKDCPKLTGCEWVSGVCVAETETRRFEDDLDYPVIDRRVVVDGHSFSCAFSDVEAKDAVKAHQLLTCTNLSVGGKQITFKVEQSSALSVFASFVLIAVALLFALF